MFALFGFVISPAALVSASDPIRVAPRRLHYARGLATDRISEVISYHGAMNQRLSLKVPRITLRNLEIWSTY